MNLSQTIKLYAEGTSDGAKKGWEGRTGRDGAKEVLQHHGLASIKDPHASPYPLDYQGKKGRVLVDSNGDWQHTSVTSRKEMPKWNNSGNGAGSLHEFLSKQ